MTALSLFSGIGGIDLAFERAGGTVVAQVELDDACNRVLAHHWPDVERIRDVRTADRFPAVDVVFGGFPCTDLSVAGKRAGLAGEQSGLWFEFHRIVAQVAPAWILIENVPGLLSSNGGHDFATILRGLEELGYGWAYRVLDAQYFGVPQRRRRVFVVGCLGSAARAAAVLFEPESVSGDSATRREAGERIADSLTVGANQYSGFPGEPVEVARSLTSGAHPGGFNGQDAGAGMLVAGTLTAGTLDHRGHAKRSGSNNPESIIAGTLKGGSSSSSRGWNNGAEDADKLIAGTLGGGAGNRGWSSDTERMTFVPELSLSLATDGGNRLNAEHTTLLPIAQLLRANRWGGSDSHGDEGNVVLAFNHQAGGDARGLAVGEGAPTLQVSQTVAVAQHGMMVRRLTPLECARLQGLPDSWLDLDPPLSDSTKYRMLGNSVAVPVLEWIFRRLLAAVREREGSAW